MKISLEQLTREIESAFANVPYPGDKNIIEKSSRWEYGKNITGGLKGVDWRDLEKASFDSETKRYALPHPGHLTHAAFQYYLPGYMLVLIRHYHEVTFWVYCIIYSLMLYIEDYKLARDVEENLEKFEMLSPDQKQAARHFLEYLEDEYSDDLQYNEPTSRPKVALDQYWNKF
ncbi:MAG: hypothetical protein JW828_00335 [Sedimentisphaerales bacterium]|nr:hypothetical protein [Sedimentisphaerales bacterium]